MEKREERLSVRNYREMRCARVLALAMALAAAAGGLFAQAAQGAGKAVPDAGEAEQSYLSGRDVVLYPEDPASSVFRFLPAGPVLPFDRSIVLSAASGERRSYLFQSGKAEELASGEAPISSYVIDKRPPAPPKAKPGTGLYSSNLAPELSAEGDADIFWALVGPGGEASPFVPYGPDSRPRLEAPVSGSASYTLVAYALGASGQRSRLSRFVYRLTEAGLPSTAPAVDSVALTADPRLEAPKVASAPGYAELSLALPPSASLLISFDSSSVPDSIDDFQAIAADENGVARLRIPCPYAWSGEVGLYYGVLKGGNASYSPAKLAVKLAYPAEEVAAPSIPPAPLLSLDPAGRAAFLAFPAYDGDIYFSLGSSKAERYESPIALPSGQTSATVSWYGENGTDRRSALSSASFDIPAELPEARISGVASFASIASDVVLKPLQDRSAPAELVVRYELRTDGSLPPEPGPSSPVLGDSLPISCPAGEERQVVLRYRSFLGDRAGEGSLLRFSLDKKPPEPPRFAEAPRAFSDKGLSLELLPGAGGKEVYASVSTDGSTAPFSLVKGPLQLPGSESGPVGYEIRAYDLDAAGNRSKEMGEFSLVVDKASVYVAEDGSDRGDGSPDRPYKSLDAAFAAASRGGKKSVNVRGSLTMRVPARFSSEISLVGGFGASWARDPSAKASVRIALPQGKPAFVQEGGSLSLRRVELDADSASSPLISLNAASCFIADSAIVCRSEGDLILLAASRSKLALSNSRIEAAKAMAFTAFSAEGSDIVVAGSSISAQAGVRIFGAFDLDGGSLSIRESLLQSSSDLGLNLLSLRSSSLSVDRSLVTVDRGSGFLRLGSFKAVSGEIKNSKVLLSWKGPGTLFEAQDGAPSLRHDTIVADSSAALRFFDIRGKLPQLWNSIFDCSAPASDFLRSDSVPAAGIVVADCVWGFDKYLAGALESRDFASLGALNALSALYSSKPCVSEPPEASFAAPLKSQAPLRRDSACVGAALPLESGYSLDFSGHQRPAPGEAAPDIGADELTD